jgi:hypothetical protein
MAESTLSPLFKTETGSIAFAAGKDGKIKLTYPIWDDAKVVLPGHVAQLEWGPQGAELRILPRDTLLAFLQKVMVRIDAIHDRFTLSTERIVARLDAIEGKPSDPPAPLHGTKHMTMLG